MIMMVKVEEQQPAEEEDEYSTNRETLCITELT